MTDRRVYEFERHLDDALAARPMMRSGGPDSLRLAANVVEAAYTVPGIEAGDRLAEGLQILAPALMTRDVRGELAVEDVLADLDFAAHYHSLRDLLYYTYNVPSSIAWSFADGRIDIRFADPTLPRQFFLVANNWFLNSMSAFADTGRTTQIEELVRGAPEFQPTERGVRAQELIHQEVDLKLALYFNLVSDVSVPAGGYTFGDFMTVYRALLTKALYHRYHARVNGSRGVISMPLEVLARDLEESVDGVSAETAGRVVEDIAYGAAARRAGLDPVYFSLYRIPESDEIVMLPHHFSTWEGIVNFLRVVALRDPQLFLKSFSGQIGDALVGRLTKAFNGAGFTVRSNVSLNAYGAHLPDIDILVRSEEPTLGYGFLVCEVKSPVPPRWAKDQLRVLQADCVAKAFEQLRRINAFLDSEDGARFLQSQVPRAGLPDFDEFAIVGKSMVITSDNAGAFFLGRGTIIDFRTMERLLSRCDGDFLYILKVLKAFPEWADNSLARQMIEVQVGETTVSYEGITVKHLMDFGQNAYRSAGEPQRMVRDMLEAGDRPLDVLRERRFDISE